MFCWVLSYDLPVTNRGQSREGRGHKSFPFGNGLGGDSTEIVRHRPPPFPSPHLARSDSRSLGLRCRSARPPGPSAPDHCQAGARTKRPVPAPCRVPVWERVARPPAGPSAAHATPKSSLGATPSGSLRLHWRRTPARLLGAAPSGSSRLHWRRTPPSPLTPRRPFPLWGTQAPAGAPPCAPWHLRRAPGSEARSRRSPLRRAGP